MNLSPLSTIQESKQKLVRETKSYCHFFEFISLCFVWSVVLWLFATFEHSFFSWRRIISSFHASQAFLIRLATRSFAVTSLNLSFQCILWLGPAYMQTWRLQSHSWYIWRLRPSLGVFLKIIFKKQFFGTILKNSYLMFSKTKSVWGLKMSSTRFLYSDIS